QIQSDMNLPVPPDLAPPTAPGGLTATPTSNNQIDLTWTAAIDNVGVTNYFVERCLSPGCADFTQVAIRPASPTAFSDTGLAAGTSYTYRVRASDAAQNLGAYSNQAIKTTLAPDTEPPSVPGVLTATVSSGSQINLSWGPATDNIAVASYRLDRCE